MCRLTFGLSRHSVQSEIGIGPGEHQKLNEAAIRLLLDANDLDAVATNISNIPFRKFF
jgi:hypothetical protein